MSDSSGRGFDLQLHPPRTRPFFRLQGFAHLPLRYTLKPPPSIPGMKNFFVAEEPPDRVLCFESKDGKHMSVELPIALEMLYFRGYYESDAFEESAKIQIDFVYGDILAYVLYFCMVKCRMDAGILSGHEAEGLCFGFSEKLYVLQDVRTIYLVLEAATALQVDLLRDLLCEIVVKMVLERPPEEVKQVFDIDLMYKDPTAVESDSDSTE